MRLPVRPGRSAKEQHGALRSIQLLLAYWLLIAPAFWSTAVQAAFESRDQHATALPQTTARQSTTTLPGTLSLEDRTRVIITHSQRPDGSIQENRGSGVVVGNYYLTVHHNLQPGPVSQFVNFRSYLGGIAVKPVFVDAGADLAIIAIPEPLCQSWCERNNLLPEAETKLDETVRWYRDPASAPQVNPGWRKGRVMGRTWSLPAQRTVGSLGADCDSGLVLEIDQPFRPGSSGAGVWDSQNRLVGIAQGSFQTRDGSETGYFKPLRCIRGHWPAQMIDSDTLAAATGSLRPLTRLGPAYPRLLATPANSTQPQH